MTLNKPQMLGLQYFMSRVQEQNFAPPHKMGRGVKKSPGDWKLFRDFLASFDVKLTEETYEAATEALRELLAKAGGADVS